MIDKTKEEMKAMLELMFEMQSQRIEFARKYNVQKAERIIDMEVDGLLIECRLKESK